MMAPIFFAKLYSIQKLNFMRIFLSKKPNIKVNSNVEINILGKNNSAISHEVMCKKHHFAIPKHHKVV